jgi:membrane-associated phospholipid phosphatase
MVRHRYRPALTRLEGRALLSGAPLALTATLAPESDPAHDGVVFGRHAVIVGETAPGAVVRAYRGRHGVERTRADANGSFRLQVRVPEGATSCVVKAADGQGHTARTDVPVAAADPVIAWNAAMLQAIRDAKTPPPVAARAMAIVQTSVYDAVNAVDPIGAPYLIHAKAPAGVSPDAAAAGAAYSSLVALFPQQKPMFDAALGAATASLRHGRATGRGIAFGESVAAQVLAARGDDGSTTTVTYDPGDLPGQWRPTPPAYAAALLPGWGSVTPFALNNGGQFLPPAPPSIGSPEYAAAVRQLENLGGKTSDRTADQTEIALFWADGAGTETPPGHWNAIAETVALARHDSLATDARNFALLDMALADAGIAAWDAKYAYNTWRPVTVIDQGDPANPQLAADPAWAPLIATPNFPSYVSGHSTFSAAAAAVLDALYGPNTAFRSTSDGLPGVTRAFTSFTQAADEAGISRIYGGIHFAFDNTAGLALGRSVGEYVVQNALPLNASLRHRG